MIKKIYHILHIVISPNKILADIMVLPSLSCLPGQ